MPGDEGEELGAGPRPGRVVVDDAAPVPADEAEPPPGARRQALQDLHEDVGGDAVPSVCHCCGGFAGVARARSMYKHPSDLIGSGTDCYLQCRHRLFRARVGLKLETVAEYTSVVVILQGKNMECPRVCQAKSTLQICTK